MEKCPACGKATAQRWGVDEICAECYREEMRGRDAHMSDPYRPDW